MDLFNQVSIKMRAANKLKAYENHCTTIRQTYLQEIQTNC